MDFFVREDSIVRKIWGKSDTVLFIFAGAAAEFALNKAVDWLYFTGRLPADPIGRLFSTVTYARRIVFSEREQALRAIDKITSIHSGVEQARGAKIPDWAYRDVLFMLIHYSIASFELLERKLSAVEKEEVYNVFKRLGDRMGLNELPADYVSWLPVRERHMADDLEKSKYTVDLFLQYRKNLGGPRYKILKQAQILVIPPRVQQLLGFSRYSWLSPAVPVYKFIRGINLDWLVKSILLPSAYKKEIRELDVVP
ncbi:MAG TPA: oxygenase MpaB family protein [Flavisolibacter sp.]|nr:oxygenase MpaB family protein [Flavisolibacter sp.]